MRNKYVWNLGERCEKDLDCGFDGKCKNGICFKPCKDDNDCTFENQCVNKICLPKICQNDADCGPGNQCIDKTCKIKCQSNQDCPKGQGCDNGECFAPPGEPCDKDSGNFFNFMYLQQNPMQSFCQQNLGTSF